MHASSNQAVGYPIRLLAGSVAIALGVTACSTAGADEPSPTPATSTTAAVPPTTTTSTEAPTPTTTRPAFISQGADPTPGQLAEYGFYPTTTVPSSYFDPIVIRVEPLPETLALTFDDGPDPEWTPIILDILKAHGARATFFVLGWKVDAYPELARRMVDEGHSLQSHGYRHHNLTNRSDAAVGKLIDDAAEAIFNATGTTPACLRPPRGITSRRLEANAAERGHLIVLWTPAGNSLDYSLQTSSGVLSRARKWEAGYVTLMHETWGFLYKRSLDAILDDLDSRGVGYSTICVPETNE